jgi:hypothetical protein
MSKIRRPSAALLVASLALFITAGGGAWAAGSGAGSRAALASNTKAKGPRGPQGPRGAVGPSDGFVKRQVAAADLPAGSDTTVVQLRLTPGKSYIVTAATELGNTSGAANLVGCTLLENSNPIGDGSAALPAENVFAQTVTLTSATTGGNIKLSCNADGGGRARNSVITAIRVGALHTQ